MPVMLNTHAVVLKNRSALRGQLGLIGVSDPQLLAAFPGGGYAVTEHFGIYQTLLDVPGWHSVFGYFDAELPVHKLETVVVFVPKARAELDLRLALAHSLLISGGELLLVGEKREGIAGAIKQLQAVTATATKLDSARHCQVWLAEPAVNATVLDPAVWLHWHQFSESGITVEVAGLPGIFSDGRLDEGTRLLLDSLSESPVQGPVLDFACGAGVIGAWLQGHSGADLVVDGVDVQAQAIECARHTYARANARGSIQASDGLATIAGMYQTIVTNPPFHTGVKLDLSMTTGFLQQAVRHLLPGGELRLVANSFLPYRQLIEQQIGPVRVLRQDRRFTVYSARKVGKKRH